MDSTGYILILITTNTKKEAEKIAESLVESRLVACVNIMPAVTSVYYWKGEVCKESEVLLVIKTRAEHFDTLVEKVTQLHSYEVPEIIALPILRGYKPYLDWIKQVT
jgi:periplasmic divalent cation tolerance protein